MGSRRRASSKSNEDYLVKDIVQTGNWSSLAACLQEHVLTESQLSWVVQKASERVTEDELVRLIPHIPGSHLPPVLVESLKRGLWGGVCVLLGRDMTQQQRQWAVSAASKRATEKDLENIMFLCRDESDLLDCALPSLVQRGQWRVVKSLLPDHLTPTQRSMVVREASKHAVQADLRWFLPHCTDDQLDLVLTEAARRQLWTAVGDLLGRRVSEKARRRTVEQALSQAGDSDLAVIACHCTDDQMDTVLREIVRRHLWGVVEKLFWRGVGRDQLQWAMVEASKHASEIFLCRIIVEYCDDSLAGPMLSEVVRRRLWTCVCDLMKYRVPIARRRWVIDEAIKHAAEKHVFSLLPHCPDDQLDYMLRETVSRRLWDCVLELMRRRNSDQLSCLAVVEASKHATSDQLRRLIRYCTCAYDTYETVLTETLRRGFCLVANQLLQTHSSAEYAEPVLKKVSEHLKDQGDVLVYQAVESMSLAVVEAALRHWPLSEDTRRLAVSRVCRSGLYHTNYREDEFVSIIQHCDHTQIFLALEAAIRRNIPHVASDILHRMGNTHSNELLTVSRDGHTVISVVIELNGRADSKLDTQCHQLLGECIKLGVSTYQPKVSDFYVPDCEHPCDIHPARPEILSLPDSNSPFKRSVVRNDLLAVRMLYESGSCSNREVHKLRENLSTWCLQSQKCLASFGGIAAYLEENTRTPRSLVSLCRLVISHHLRVGCTRHERVKQLPLPVTLRDYVLFSDILNFQSADAISVVHAANVVYDVREIACEIHDYEEEFGGL